MPVVPLSSGAPLGTFELLDRIVDTLGSTKATFWPFLEGTGSTIAPYGKRAGDDQYLTSSDEGGAVALESEFAPLLHVGGVHSYLFQAALNNHLAGGDDADYSFGNGTTDDAFSVGICLLDPSNFDEMSLMSKYDDVAAEDREWQLYWSTGDIGGLELYDEANDGKEVGLGVWAPPTHTWRDLIATYDGAQADPEVFIYQNGVARNDGTTSEPSPYTAMTAGATPLLIGAHNLTGAPAGEWIGRLALPFITGKKLSAAEAASVSADRRKLLGF